MYVRVDTHVSVIGRVTNVKRFRDERRGSVTTSLSDSYPWYPMWTDFLGPETTKGIEGDGLCETERENRVTYRAGRYEISCLELVPFVGTGGPEPVGEGTIFEVFDNTKRGDSF